MKKEIRWLFTEWSLGLSSFRIYDSYDTFNYITGREIGGGNNVNWFNIDNVKREIELFAEKNNIKIKGLNETLNDIKSHGFSYKNSEKQQYILDAEKRNKEKGTNIKIID